MELGWRVGFGGFPAAKSLRPCTREDGTSIFPAVSLCSVYQQDSVCSWCRQDSVYSWHLVELRQLSTLDTADQNGEGAKSVHFSTKQDTHLREKQVVISDVRGAQV